MAKPNYAFEKRQRELEKKRKKEEKAQRKAAGHVPAPGEPGDAPADDTPPPPAPQP
ncbi:MAG: hypothetical protein LCI02_02725 [Proteobacteria bacterium]|nr:hypothetical protein [Pseudomonadota bacterium]